MWLFNFKIRNNEQCPCGSGKSYRICCKGKDSSVSPSKKPPEVLIMEKMRASMAKCCMHPDKSRCNGKIKNAHALQNNKIISLLAGSDRHVYMLNTKKQPLLIPLNNTKMIPLAKVDKVSANDATTETCFCDLHDNIAFAIIEKGAPDFDETRDDMKFVYAYKAFIFEYYKQWVSMDIYRRCFPENPSAFISPEMVAKYRMLQMRMREFEPIKQHFDRQILSGTFEGITTCAIKMPFQIKFADYAYIALDFDLNGKRIKHTQKGIMHRVAVTVFPEQTQSWLLVSCLENEKHIYEGLFEQLQTATIDKLKYYLNLVLPLYSENVVLGSSLWTSWDESTQAGYIYYANLNGPDAVRTSCAVKMALVNASKDKSGDAYTRKPKLDLFS